MRTHLRNGERSAAFRACVKNPANRFVLVLVLVLDFTRNSEDEDDNENEEDEVPGGFSHRLFTPLQHSIAEIDRKSLTCRR